MTEILTFVTREWGILRLRWGERAIRKVPSASFTAFFNRPFLKPFVTLTFGLGLVRRAWPADYWLSVWTTSGALLTMESPLYVQNVISGTSFLQKTEAIIIRGVIIVFSGRFIWHVPSRRCRLMFATWIYCLVSLPTTKFLLQRNSNLSGILIVICITD